MNNGGIEDINVEINLEEIDDFLEFINKSGNGETEEDKEEEVHDCNDCNLENYRNEEINTSEAIEKIKKKVEKICVAPGEKGTFKNWGEDAFIEEKAFPELFPLGIGGYLSSTLKRENHEFTGFAMYVKHRIMSANPKFREHIS